MVKKVRKKRERKGYFYEREEEAFVKYLKSEDKDERNKIFNEILYPAFTKMVESIIRRYKLYRPDEDFEETFGDTMSFLITKMEKFNPDSGYKAYSYCGTICKNFLIWRINQYVKEIKTYDRYDLISDTINESEKYSYDPKIDKLKALNALIKETSDKIQSMVDRKEELNLTEQEAKVGLALIDMLNNWEDLFERMGSRKFNKSSILLNLKELTCYTTTEIRKGMKIYRPIYETLRKSLLEDIYI